jgi:hypothetical protein
MKTPAHIHYGSHGVELLRPKRLPDNHNPIGHPQPHGPGGARSNVGQDNIAGPNEILHTLPETVLSQ